MTDNITLPRSVVEQAMYHLNRGDADAVCWADGVIKPALEQPQRKLTQQDIAYNALLGNIESPFNACMHQEHCKRWKAQADQQHQRKLSSDNELQRENCHLITSSSSVPQGEQELVAWINDVMEQAQVFASAWSLVGSRFDSGDALQFAERTKAELRAMLAAAPQPPVVEQHTDDAAVNRFAEAMKAKLAVARDKGRGGWDDPAQCTVEYLAKLLVDHIAKGDPIDVANFAMMLHQRQADKSVLSAAAPTPPAVDHPEPAYLLRDLEDDISVDALDLIAAIRDAGLGNYSINMMLPARVCVAMCQRFAAAPQLQVAAQPTGGAREAFEAWCHLAGLMQHSHGIVSISSHTDTAWLAWQAAIANCQQPKVEQEPVAVIGDVWTLNWVGGDPIATIVKKHGLKIGDKLYTLPHPQRELTKEEARRIYNAATYHASLAIFMTRMDAEHPDADDKGVSGWLQEAEDRVKRRITEAAHNIVGEA